MANPHAHRLVADELLGMALENAVTSPVRLAYLAEAQVHATLYLADVTAAAHTPRVVNLTAETIGTTVHEAIEEQAPAPKTTRRPRKATTAKDSK